MEKFCLVGFDLGRLATWAEPRVGWLNRVAPMMNKNYL